MRRRLAARDILGARQKLHFLAGRDVQNVHLRARLARQANEPLGRAQGRDLVAPDRMRGRDRRRRAGACARSGAPRPRCGRRRGGGSALRIASTPSSSATRRRPVEEPMNTLIPAAPGRRSSSGMIGDIVMRAADPEGEVAMHAALRPGELVGERLGAGRRADRCWAFRTRPSRRRAQPRASRSPGPPCERAPARENAPGNRSRREECEGRGSRCARPPRRRSKRRSRRSARRGRRCRATPIPSWLTTVPLIRTQSKLGGMADLSCSGAKAAYLTGTALASATGGVSHEQESRHARGSRRRFGERRGGDRLSAGPADQRRRAARARRSALCGAAHAAGQDPVRHDRRARARRRGPAYLIDCAAAQAADLARRLGFYKLRAKVAIADASAEPRRRRLLGRRAGAGSTTALLTPTRAIRASAGARSCRARSPPRSGSEHAGEYEGLRIAVGRAQRRPRFRLWRRLPARRQFRSSARRRFRQGLLCRPGGRLAHEASRNGAQAHCARQTGRPARPRPGRRSWTASLRSARSAPPRDARRSRCSASIGSRRRARRAAR